MNPETAERLATWARYAQACEAVRTASKHLLSDGKVMPMKGVLLGALGIVQPAQRALRDIDLLVDGVNLGTAVERLGRAGFRLVDVPIAPGAVSLSHPLHPLLWVDVHVRPVPIGLGRITRSYLFETAREDLALFGERVFVPSPPRLVVALIGNIVKDRVVYARRHTADDLAACLTGPNAPGLDAVAKELRAVSLMRAGAHACTWAHAWTGSPALHDLLTVLEPSRLRRDALQERLRATWPGNAQTFMARLSGRAVSDSLVLKVAAPLAAAAGALALPFRRRSLALRNRGDASRNLR